MEGTPIIGICGGYQMLGKRILDPLGIESKAATIPGLGLLEVVTSFEPRKATRQVKGIVNANHGLLEGMRGEVITGYEIHMGKTSGNGRERVFRINDTPQGTDGYDDGTLSTPGTVMGTYLHGLFLNDNLRQNLLDYLRRRYSLAAKPKVARANQEEHFDRLAALVRSSLDLKRLYQTIERGLNV
jgi:adenosylcobyric acid synthase